MGINRGYSIRKIRMKNRYVHPLAKLDKTGGTVVLQFPEDKTYLEHHIMFTIFDKKRESRDSADMECAIATITLPITQELQVSYNAGYANPDLGGITASLLKAAESGSGAIAEMASNSLDQNKKLMTDLVANILANPGEAAKSLGNGVANAGGAVLNQVAGLGGDIAKAGMNAFGIARNPHKATLFEGTDFRSHSFNFKLSPMSASESVTIRQIIHLFKYHMHPGYAGGTYSGVNLSSGNHFFSTPEFFRIDLDRPTGKYTVNDYKPCVLKGMTVNYQPSNYPAYARSKLNQNEPAPMEVVMGLEFQEIEIITKDWIGDPYLSKDEAAGQGAF
jgi:hypothetical protein